MINLNDAPEQKEAGGGGPIPPKSMVKVQIEVREPKNADPQDTCVNIFSTGLKGVDLEFTVVSGTYEGVRIWENWFLPPGMQTISLTKGQEGTCNGSFAKMRAAVEASRGLDPADPNANRNIQSWYDFNQMEIPVKIGVNKPKAGDKYINNCIAKVLTSDDEDFDLIMSGGEIITDNPFPEIPGGSAPTGGNTPPHPADDPNAAPPPVTGVKTPSWAQRKK